MPRHIDENGREYWTRIVYVIELDKAACSNRQSPCGGSNCGRTPVYVGETAHTAKDRFEQHKRGYRASRWVKKHGLHVRRQLARGFGEMATVTESEAAEHKLALRLRKRDGGKRYCVYGGH